MGSATSGRQKPTQAVDVSKTCPPHLYVSNYVHVVRRNWSDQDEMEMGIAALAELQREWRIGAVELAGVLDVGKVKVWRYKNRYVADEDEAIEAIKEFRIQDDEVGRVELAELCLASEGDVKRALDSGVLKPKRMLGKVMVFGLEQAHELTGMLVREAREREEHKKKMLAEREAKRIKKSDYMKTVGAKKSALAKEYRRRYRGTASYAENWWGE